MADPLLSAAEMNEIGADLAFARPDTCVILRKPTGRDPGGAPISGAYTAVATVGCRVDATQRQPLEAIFGGRFGPQADYTVALPRGTAITTDDRIAVNGTTLEVIGVPEIESFFVELVVGVKAAG